MKNSDITVGGDLGSLLKMWWISGFAVYRSGAGELADIEGSGWMVRRKASLLYGAEEPKEAIVIVARTGDEDERNWWGISFADCIYVSFCDRARGSNDTYNIQFGLASILHAECK